MKRYASLYLRTQGIFKQIVVVIGEDKRKLFFPLRFFLKNQQLRILCIFLQKGTSIYSFESACLRHACSLFA